MRAVSGHAESSLEQIATTAKKRSKRAKKSAPDSEPQEDKLSKKKRKHKDSETVVDEDAVSTTPTAPVGRPMGAIGGGLPIGPTSFTDKRRPAPGARLGGGEDKMPFCFVGGPIGL